MYIKYNSYRCNSYSTNKSRWSVSFLTADDSTCSSPLFSVPSVDFAHDSLINHNLCSTSFSIKIKLIFNTIAELKTRKSSYCGVVKVLKLKATALSALQPSTQPRDATAFRNSHHQTKFFLQLKPEHNTMNGTQDSHHSQTHPIKTHSIQMRHLLLWHQAPPHPTSP